MCQGQRAWCDQRQLCNEECVDFLLHKVNGFWGQQGGVVGVVGILDSGAVGGGFLDMGGILWARRLGVLELV